MSVMRRLLTIGVAALALAAAGWAQPVPGRRPGPDARGPRAAARRRLIERWNQMTPAERRRALEKLPPERRRAIEERLERFRNMPPGERQQLQRRLERFNELPPGSQEAARRLYQRFATLAPERRRSLRQEFNRLREMPEAERQARMESQEFRNRFDPKEQQLLHDLTGLVGRGEL